MSELPFPEPDEPVAPTSPESLKRRIDAGESVTVLDVRAASEYEAWHIDGETVETANVPYFAFLDGASDAVLDRVPDADELVVVCAKGESSRFVAGLLAEAGYDATNLERGMRGWASLYEYDELDADTDAVVAQYRRPSSGCLAYMVVSEGEAAVVDPLRAFTDEYVQDAKTMGASIEYVLDTHVHADHVSGLRTLADAAGATALMPAPAVARGVDYAVETVADGDSLTVGAVDIDVLHTPGHTSGMTAYLVDDSVLLTGDTLFTESVARPDLEEGADGAADAAATLHDTLQDLQQLRDDTLVAPAHFSDAATPRPDGTYAARLGDLVESMPALSLDREAFVAFVLDDMPPRPSNYEAIIAANLGHEAPDDATAFELELGPNNCAASREAITE
ncbi:MBL fold metallo-hydrolase [Natronomonas sp. EA1]|uniref:MBL fold metallo-hydrolase n=1 Tax=Natronomonas sp. EA1 TaxID=3421655 RepID=UPI003EB810C3